MGAQLDLTLRFRRIESVHSDVEANKLGTQTMQTDGVIESTETARATLRPTVIRSSLWAELPFFARHTAYAVTFYAIAPWLFQVLSSHERNVIAVAVGVFLLAKGLWQICFRLSNKYVFEDKWFVWYRSSFLSTTDYMKYNTVRDVRVLKPWWLTPFGLGHVVVMGFDRSDPEFTFVAIDGADRVATFLNDKGRELRGYYTREIAEGE